MENKSYVWIGGLKRFARVALWGALSGLITLAITGASQWHLVVSGVDIMPLVLALGLGALLSGLDKAVRQKLAEECEKPW